MHYRLPSTFNNFFKSINKVYQYATRLASKKSYYLPKARANYGIFNIRFSGQYSGMLLKKLI